MLIKAAGLGETAGPIEAARTQVQRVWAPVKSFVRRQAESRLRETGGRLEPATGKSPVSAVAMGLGDQSRWP